MRPILRTLKVSNAIIKSRTLKTMRKCIWNKVEDYEILTQTCCGFHISYFKKYRKTKWAGRVTAKSTKKVLRETKERGMHLNQDHMTSSWVPAHRDGFPPDSCLACLRSQIFGPSQRYNHYFHLISHASSSLFLVAGSRNGGACLFT